MRNQLRRCNGISLLGQKGVCYIIFKADNSIYMWHVTVLKASRGQFCIVDLVWGHGGRPRASVSMVLG